MQRATCAVLGPARLAGLVLLVVLVSARAGAHGSFHDRLDRLDTLISASPYAAELYVARAELYSSQSHHRRALRDIERAGVLAPKRGDLALVRGRIRLNAGQPERAEPLLRRFLQDHPTHAVARLTLARVLAELGRHLEAAGEFTRGIDAMPSPSPEPFRERSRALRAVGPEHWASAIRGLDEGIARLGPVVTLELAALDLEVELGRIDQALDWLDRIAARSARQESWWARRGGILEHADRPLEARTSFEEALRALRGLSVVRQRTPAMQRLRREALEAVARLGANRRKVAGR
jgi:tetratricopeptide (TPR) repeat protein